MPRRREITSAALTCVCLRCGHDCDMPEADERVRVLTNPDTSKAEVWVDVTTPCDHCGATRVRITVSFTMSGGDAS